ncbi:hypothetical protein [Seleniivibrio woodruffii]|uniref:hypothetical protein n=1 Tax=Seleniivibrio woodruffii TaxID=1078050 RepID=UPI002409BF6B|nr:hypothetical protein [Seleniivibrio woodruffii]
MNYITQNKAAKYLKMSVNTFKKNIMPYIHVKLIGRKKMVSQEEIDDFMSKDYWQLKRKLRNK